MEASPRLRETCNLPDSRDDSPLFDFDRADLRARGEKILDGLATCMLSGKLKNDSVHAVGFADPRGSDTYNMELGSRRAEAARQYLVGQGVSGDRIGAATCGKCEAVGNGRGDVGRRPSGRGHDVGRRVAEQ